MPDYADLISLLRSPVRVEARKAVEAARGRRLPLSAGTGTTPDITLVNIRAMIEAALT